MFLTITIKTAVLLLFATYSLYAQMTTVPLGSGTISDPYMITSLGNLFWLSQTDSVWDKNAYFIQTDDIDAGDREDDDMRMSGFFHPIGNRSRYFQGHYNGKGHVIKELYVDVSNDYVGLFGYTKNATIDSMELFDIRIAGYDYVGGLIGYNSSSVISNSHVTGTIWHANNSVGGLVGVNDCSTISNSSATVTVVGQAKSGGLIGHNKSSSIVLHSTAAGNVYGTNDVGGLVGNNDSSTISYSSAAGNISGSQAFVGGLIGENFTSIVSNCYSTGIVSGSNVDVGGLIGGNRSSSKVINTYATGNVSGSAGVGGLIGINEYNSSIANSYSTGSVSASSESGGFLGINLNSKIINCFWNTETSRTSTGIGNDYGNNQTVTALTINQMKNKNSFVNWDFDSVWNINEGISYPLLFSVEAPTVVHILSKFKTNGCALINAPSLLVNSENTMSHNSGNVTFSIITSAPSEVHVTICNIAGKALFKKHSNSNSFEKTVTMSWDLHNYRGYRTGNGVYLIIARVHNRNDGSAHLLTTKIVR
jgi:hypothetical protein